MQKLPKNMCALKRSSIILERFTKLNHFKGEVYRRYEFQVLTNSLWKLAIHYENFCFFFITNITWWDIEGQNTELTLVLSLQIRPRTYSAGKYVWHRLWKGERSRWDTKQNKWLNQSSRPRWFFRKGVMRNSQNLQENTFAGVSFLIKLNPVDLQPHSKTRLRRRVFLVNIAKSI